MKRSRNEKREDRIDDAIGRHRIDRRHLNIEDPDRRVDPGDITTKNISIIIVIVIVTTKKKMRRRIEKLTTRARRAK